MAGQLPAPEDFSHALWGQAELGDARRTKRVVKTFAQICRHPGGTLPDKLSSPADLKALYRWCDCPEVTHAALVKTLGEATQQRVAEHSGPVLLLHDATELDYTSRTSLKEQLGQIGKGRSRGYVCHNVLAVAADTGEVLGLRHQILHHRVQAPAGESLTARRDRETRESLLWLKGSAAAPNLPQVIDIADQGAGTFEFFAHEVSHGRRFVIRDGKPRKVHAGHEPTGSKQPLRAYVQSLPELGRFTMAVQAQKKRVARKSAEFALRGGPVLILPPHAKHGHFSRQPLPLYVVRVTEVAPPAGAKPIEWLLVTTEPVRSYADAWRITAWYERRWIVEEYHKALKTGCQIEDLQFTSVARLEPMIALLSAVAVTLLNLRDASRRADAETCPATKVVDAEYVEVLSAWRRRKSKPPWTVHDFFQALARLGGHQNRARDHQPGWLVLWRGWTKLQLMLDGYRVARNKCG